MQPRSERVPDRGETVFQVTKRGLSVRLEPRRWEVRREAMPMGVKELVEPIPKSGLELLTRTGGLREKKEAERKTYSPASLQPCSALANYSMKRASRYRSHYSWA